MPFTPLHFGPHACVALPLRRRVDLPVFLLTNVVVDVEPLLVLTFNLNYPLHGNPLYGLSSYQALSGVCLACFLPAFAIYIFIVAHTERRTADS